MAKPTELSFDVNIDYDAANKHIAEIAEKFGVLKVSLEEFCDTVNEFNLDVSVNKKED